MSTLDCTDVKANLSALVDDTIDADSRRAAERHLAECAACRGLVDEVERADAALAEAAARATADRLPDGFAPAVLARTVYSDRLNGSAGRGLTAWLGWIAAAACLALAIVTWIVNNAPTTARSRPQTQAVGNRSYALGPQFRSWTHEGEPSSEALSHLLVQPAAAPATVAAAGEPSPAGAAAAEAPPALTPLDADTIDSAAYILERLSMAEADSFAELETVRRAAEYDDIVPRLTALRDRLAAEDRNAVLAAEAVLFRLVNGPLDLADAAALRESIADLRIVQRLDEIGSRQPVASAL